MTDDLINKLAKHILRASRVPGLESARCVVAVEMAFLEADWIHSGLREFINRNPDVLPDTSFLREPGSGRKAGQIGIMTTNNTKETMSRMLRAMIEKHKFAIHKDFTCAEADTSKRWKILDQLCTQLIKYERVVETRAGNVFADPKIIYSGKRHGPDDLAICVQLNVLAHMRWNDAVAATRAA